MLKRQINTTVKYHKETLDNGLNVILIPKKDFYETHASLVINYGSSDHIIIDKVLKEEKKFPEGIAHFLEHKMFDQKDNTNIFLEFSKIGTNANAYTSYDKTAYTFSSTKDTLKSLDILLDYVFNPYFTDTSVEKEKGIIAQEIKMYDDNLDYLCYRLALSKAYQKHPIGKDIAGTIESIDKITKKDLYDCYNYFYQPSNMCLILAGDFDINSVMLKIKKFNYRKSNAYIDDIKVKEIHDKDIIKKNRLFIKYVNASTNYVCVLYKDIFFDNCNIPDIFKCIITDFINNLLFSEISKNYYYLIDRNFVNTPLEYYSSYDKEYGYIMYNCTTEDYDKLIKELNKIIKNTTLNEEEFNLLKKSYYSSRLRKEAYPSYSVSFLSNSFFDSKNSIFFEDVNNFINELSFDFLNKKYKEIQREFEKNTYITVLKKYSIEEK